ncbi:MAG: hypothetical protein P4L90_08415 [Rhodopila sp.]|nr:hypothetical protein [Rhodopila sp.]
MPSARILAPLGVFLTLGACAVAPPPGFPAMVVPGSGKDLAAFQEDDAICRQHAINGTGYNGPAPAAAQSTVQEPAGAVASGAEGGGAAGSAASTSAPPTSAGAEPQNEVGYLQCMAARGDAVWLAPPDYGAPYPGYYSGGYPYAYPYGYAYPYPDYYGGFYGAWGWGGGWHGGGWHGGGWHGGGWHGGGWHGAGWHGGGGHGGGGHGGGGHGSGGGGGGHH